METPNALNFFLVIAALLLIFGGIFYFNFEGKKFSPLEGEDEVDWLETLIGDEITNPVANPPASVLKCNYLGKTVYHLSARCCDVYGFLYNQEGRFICSPDGGFTGKGDGKCLDFFDTRTNCEVVWQDDRKFTKDITLG